MTEEKKQLLKNKISEYSREELENKFISLVSQQQKKEKHIDFTNQKIKRRLQYLHKKYTDNARLKNALLNELLETKNEDLQIYFDNFYYKLEKKAQTEYYDEPLEDFPLKFNF